MQQLKKQLLNILNKELADATFGKIKLEKSKTNEFDQYGYQYRISDGISSAPLGYKNPDVENDYFYPADKRYGMDEVHRNSVEELRNEALYAIERMERKLYSNGRTYHCYLKIENLIWQVLHPNLRDLNKTHDFPTQNILYLWAQAFQAQPFAFPVLSGDYPLYHRL